MYLAEYASSSLGLKLAPEARRFTAAAVNGELPTLFTRMIVCCEWEENTKGRDAAMLVLPIIAQAARWRASPLPLVSPLLLQCRPYVFEGVDEGDRWYNGSKRTCRGFQFHMCELRSTTGTLSSGLDERTDGQIWRRPTPPWKSPCGYVCATTKQQLCQRRRRQRGRQNSATLRLTIVLVLWGISKPRGDLQDARIFGRRWRLIFWVNFPKIDSDLARYT